MSIAKSIEVNTHYTRSVNLERDSASEDAIRSYIPTSRAIRTTQRIVDAFETGVAPRAWSLVGPYGSGKSSYALFLSQLLQDPSDQNTGLAMSVMEAAEADLQSACAAHTQGTSGYLRVLLTGAPEPLGLRILTALTDEAIKFWKGRKGKNPGIVQKLEVAANSESVSASEVLKLVKELQIQLTKAGSLGVILIIDELGKFLEYEARHYGTNDIYLLQTLAEHACSSGESKLFLFVLLHQSFEQYAKGLGENLKKEWSKVQGRFEEVPFIESSEQVMRVVSAAFTQNLNRKERSAIKGNVTGIVATLHSQGALPTGLSKTHAIKLFTDCYPLHPVTALLLPVLCQKVAQNERTLFSYLGSLEEHGLQDTMRHIETIENFVLPSDIYDYFVTNQPAVLGDYLTHRRWAEVVTALERVGDASSEVEALLKTIGLLNIVGGKGGFKSSEAVLSTIFQDTPRFTKALKFLKSQSVVTYRKFGGDYRVWQGSDFDLEAAIDEWLSNLGDFSLAESLTRTAPMQPIVARRYAIQSGSLRFFTPVFVDASNYTKSLTVNNEPRVVFFLATGKDDEEIFYRDVQSFFGGTDVLVLCLNGVQLREVVAECMALEKVGQSRQELNSDPVAKREFEDRLTAAQAALDFMLQSLIEDPSTGNWFHVDSPLNIRSKRDLQQSLSTVMDSIYPYAPRIYNELINRDRPSSQANAARNKLLCAMLSYPSEIDLGIEKYPAEKSLYRSILRQTGLHQAVDSLETKWQFVPPEDSKKSDSANLRPVWERISDFLDSTESDARSFSELNAELIAPPYGVKIGLLPILYVTASIIYKDELALYENRRYVPGFTADMLERFVKRPDEYTVQRFRVDGVRASILREYSEVIVFKNPGNATLLGFASELAKFFGRLPAYTHKTRRGLSDTAIAVRTEFNLAKSPEKLIFTKLPEILGYGDTARSSGDTRIDGFAHTLKTVLAELDQAYLRMLDRQKELLAEAFSISKASTLVDLREQLVALCSGLENYTIDRSFLNQINQQTMGDKEWLESILSFLGHKPTEKWTDADQDTAEYRLSGFARKLVDLLKLKAHEMDVKNTISGDFDVYLLRSVKKGANSRDQVVAIDPKSMDTLDSSLRVIKKALEKLPDEELQLAVVARLVDDFLGSYNKKRDSVPFDAELDNTDVKIVVGGDNDSII